MTEAKTTGANKGFAIVGLKVKGSTVVLLLNFGAIIN